MALGLNSLAEMRQILHQAMHWAIQADSHLALVNDGDNDNDALSIGLLPPKLPP